MALSGSFSFTVDRDELIKSSLRLLGVGHRGEPIIADEINDANMALNIMLKAWQADGLHLWKREAMTLPLIAGVAEYTLGPTGNVTMQRPLRIVECVRRDTTANNIDVPLNKLSMQEYYKLSNKFFTGIPVSYVYDPQLGNGKLTVWQVPDTLVASRYDLVIVYLQPMEDMINTHDNFDCPSEWLEAIKYGLAVRLAPEYGIDLPYQYLLKKQFDEIFEKAMMWDLEDTSIYLQPNYEGRPN